MNANEREYSKEFVEALITRVIGAIYEVSNQLGAGYLEKVCERALIKELGLRGIGSQAQVPLAVMYKGECVGDYFIDILVEGCLIIELKCCEMFADEHMAQCLNYLKATGHTICLLVNFQHPKVQWKRIVRGH